MILFRVLITIFLFIPCFTVMGQNELLDMLEKEVKKEEPKNKKVYATFKATRIINAQSCETMKKKALDFRVTHRFGNILQQSNGSGGPSEFFGMDAASDIRISFDYGITDRIQIGIGRSKLLENIDGNLKIKILEQTTNNKVPFSLVWYSCMAITPRKETPDTLYREFGNRISYIHQLIIARKFGDRFSLELLPTVLHRNAIIKRTNEANGASDENTLFALGIAARFKVTTRFTIVADYFHPFSPYRYNNPDPNHAYWDPIGIGVEIETGGHVFTMNFTNSAGIIENYFLHTSNQSWHTGAIKWGFNISRVFHF